MAVTRTLLLLFLLTCIPGGLLLAQKNDTIPIPHETFKEKWLWPHRLIARMITKDRPPFQDTTYYIAYKKRLVVTLPVSTRTLTFSIDDKVSGKTLYYVPNTTYDLGLSINSRWASFLVNTGVSFPSTKSKEKGKTSFKDYQFNIYGKRFMTDANLQLYHGFYLRNAKELLPDNVSMEGEFEKRPDIYSTALGVSTSYILNYKRFSYRGSFAFTERQLKSAGSLLFGGYFSFLYTEADSSLVSDNYQALFDTSSYIRSAYSQKIGLNIGYAYTFVIKRSFYVTVSLINGFGLDHLTTTTENGMAYDYKYSFSSKASLRLATGYDNGRIFCGLMGIYDNFGFSGYSKLNFDYGYGKFRVFVGYRLNMIKQERWLLRKLNLIDWR